MLTEMARRKVDELHDWRLSKVMKSWSSRKSIFDPSHVLDKMIKNIVRVAGVESFLNHSVEIRIFLPMSHIIIRKTDRIHHTSLSISPYLLKLKCREKCHFIIDFLASDFLLSFSFFANMYERLALMVTGNTAAAERMKRSEESEWVENITWLQFFNILS